MAEKKNRSRKNNDLKAMIEPKTTRQDRFGLWLADVLGSMGFLSGCIGAIIIYICWNLNIIPGLKPFDKFPFNILSLAMSAFAIILTVMVLISENRQRKIEKIREQVEFEVNVRAEHEITKVLTMLNDIQRKLGIHKTDPEPEEMKNPTDLQQIHKNVGESHDQL